MAQQQDRFYVYVVYRALNVYQGWIERGLPNARYFYSKPGWFDNDIFEGWFIKFFLPFAKTKDVTALISNNLSSHFSEDVLRLCRKYNVKFICLPSNSTDKPQAFDAAFFSFTRPLKIKQRKILKTGKQITKRSPVHLKQYSLGFWRNWLMSSTNKIW